MRGRKSTKQAARRPVGVHLNRAMSKLGILTRSQATEAILAGRVRVDGLVIEAPGAPVDLDRAKITVDGVRTAPAVWRTLLLHKPRGVVTSRSDPQQRKTVYDLLGDEALGLVPIGRLDMATSGLLMLTSDTRLAEWVTNPENDVPRVYIATVRGEVTSEDAATLEAGVSDGKSELRAESVQIRKASGRESHLTIELREGKNREVRRLCDAIGHEVTRLKRVSIGGFELGDLAVGRWREVRREEVDLRLPAFAAQS